MRTPIANKLRLPVTVLLERRLIKRSFWTMPSWYLHTVAVGDNITAAAAGEAKAVPSGHTNQGELFAWSGFAVTLYKDACERYWHALIGNQPLIYVVCRDESLESVDEDDKAATINPCLVTIDYDEASASAETDELVLSGPIPPELYRYMEAFVLQHYTPKPFKKRKRRQWAEGSSPAAHPQQRDGHK